jgi:lycopene cyclase domain-containing protein
MRAALSRSPAIVGWSGRLAVGSVGGIAAVALIYTTPWDDLIIRQGVWSYPAERILGVTIGRVPLEECFFYVLQVVLVGLLWTWSTARRTRPDRSDE